MRWGLRAWEGEEAGAGQDKTGAGEHRESKELALRGGGRWEVDGGGGKVEGRWRGRGVCTTPALPVPRVEGLTLVCQYIHNAE